MLASMHIDCGISTSAHAMMAIECPITLRFLNYLSYAKLERSKSENFDILMVFKTQFPSGTFQLHSDSAILCAYLYSAHVLLHINVEERLSRHHLRCNLSQMILCS